MVESALEKLGLALTQLEYHQTELLPAFSAPQFRPWRELKSWHRLLTRRPEPLTVSAYPRATHRWFAHRYPGAFAAYELFYLHRTVPRLPHPDLAPYVESTPEGYRARVQITSVAGNWIMSSIPGRTEGEFVYLGEDSGRLVRWAQPLEGQRALDFCCGCGVVGLALEARFQEVVGVDISERAIETAKDNATLNRKNVRFLVSDLWDEVEGRFDLVIGNPPALPPQLVQGEHLFAVADVQLFWRTLDRLPEFLSPGGRAFFVLFSAGEELLRGSQERLPAGWSLEYRVNESYRLTDAQIPWLHHVQLAVADDGLARRTVVRRPPGGIPLSNSQALQECGAADLRQADPS